MSARGFEVDHGQYGRACKVCTTPNECDHGSCLAFEYCHDCGEREDRCVCGTEDDDCPICGEINCCEDTHHG